MLRSVMPMLLILTLSTMLLMDVVRSEAAEHERDPSKEALQLLFNKYGGRKIGGMTFEGFEHMMESLGLGDIVIMDHDVHDHHSDDGHFHSLHDNHIHDDLPQQSDDHEVHDDVDSDHLATISHDESGRQKRSADASTVQQSAVNTSDISQCLTPVNILRLFHIDGDAVLISETDFIHMCPTFVYQLDAHLCHPEIHPACHAESINRRQHCRRYHGLLDADRLHRRHSESHRSLSSMADPTVWVSATVAVTVISLVGLLAVIIIPFMSRRNFYNHLLHFLVDVAIATLTGDALLHLLPHALMPHEKHQSDHVNTTTSGDSHVHVDNEDDMEDVINHAGTSMEIVWKGLVVLAGVYVFFITERVISLFRTARRRRNKKTDVGLNEVGHRSHQNNETFMICKSTKNTDTQSANDVDDESHERYSLNAVEASVQEEQSPHHDHHQHHHHYNHGHDHDLSSSTISSAAWMVIMGDGLHNFTDGLAIGASFANDIAGGIATTTAVFCHELPHELGDFAVLLRSGMSVKQAVTYNMVSSVLAFTGMCVGIVVGTSNDTASSWVFLITAGIFIYVSLVDMLPEITREADDSCSCTSMCISLIIDVVGLSLGLVIMTSIAFHEHHIELLFADQ